MNLKSKRDGLFSYHKETNFLRYKQFNLERDLLRIAYTLFDAEKKLKEGQKVDKISIYLSEETYERIDVLQLKEIIKELALLILLEDLKLQITAIDDLKGRIRKDNLFPRRMQLFYFLQALIAMQE